MSRFFPSTLRDVFLLFSLGMTCDIIRLGFDRVLLCSSTPLLLLGELAMSVNLAIHVSPPVLVLFYHALLGSSNPLIGRITPDMIFSNAPSNCRPPAATEVAVYRYRILPVVFHPNTSRKSDFLFFSRISTAIIRYLGPRLLPPASWQPELLRPA